MFVWCPDSPSYGSFDKLKLLATEDPAANPPLDPPEGWSTYAGTGKAAVTHPGTTKVSVESRL